MITRALENQLEGNEIDVGLAEKYLSKIIQLPLALPDSNNNKMEEFVNQQLGLDFESLCNEDDDLNISKQESSEINQDGTGCHYAVNIDGNGCHCALPISPRSNESCQVFSSKVVQFLAPVTRFLCRLFHRKPGPENKNSNRRLSTPLQMMMLLPTYSPGEQQAITYLSKVAEGFGRLPREWKRFLTYHRVAWNVLSQDRKVRQCAGWQVQLIIWIFCCWQWKDQIDKIIENWKKLVPVDGCSINNKSISSVGDEDNSDDEEEEARDMFEIMHEKNSISWLSLITGLARHRCGKEAMDLFRQMQKQSMLPNKYTFGSILRPCAGNSALLEKEQTRAYIIKTELGLNVDLASSLVDMYAKCRRIEDARQVFETMSEPNVVT